MELMTAVILLFAFLIVVNFIWMTADFLEDFTDSDSSGMDEVNYSGSRVIIVTIIFLSAASLNCYNLPSKKEPAPKVERPVVAHPEELNAICVRRIFEHDLRHFFVAEEAHPAPLEDPERFIYEYDPFTIGVLDLNRCIKPVVLGSREALENYTLGYEKKNKMKHPIFSDPAHRFRYPILIGVK